MNSAENEQLVCRHVLQRLADGGQPPHHGIMRINVGNESYLDVLASEYLDDLLHRGSAFKLVQGHFGAGKTHFLLCVRELAWQRGFACALVELSPEECPYDDSRATYAATARAISVPGRDVMDEPISGLGNVLREAMLSKHSLDPPKISSDVTWIRSPEVQPTAPGAHPEDSPRKSIATASRGTDAQGSPEGPLTKSSSNSA